MAPRTRTPSISLPTPFICTKNSVLTRRDASESPSPRVPHNESTSSIKIIAGLFSLAIWNSCLTNRSDSPIHFETKSEDETEKKVELASVATAFAKNDFPVPGGPYNKIPFHGTLFPMVVKHAKKRQKKRQRSVFLFCHVVSTAVSLFFLSSLTLIQSFPSFHTSKEVRKLNGENNSLLERFLGSIQSCNIRPLHIRFL